MERLKRKEEVTKSQSQAYILQTKCGPLNAGVYVANNLNSKIGGRGKNRESRRKSY